jgi:hypothetical protein
MDDQNVYIAPHTTDVVGFARWMARRWRQAFADLRQENKAASSNWASLLGHKCLRHIYYKRTGAEAKELRPETQAIFESGNLIERDTVSAVRQHLELDWVRSQDSVPKDSLNIGAKIDGGIRGLYNREDPYLLAEVKRVNQREWAKITDGDIQGIHDMREKCAWWIQKYVTQGAIYLHYFQEPGLIFILREPSSGWAKFVPMPLNASITVELWEEAKDKAETINAALKAEAIPDRMPWHKQICGMCDFADTVCYPERANKGAEILDHPDLIKAAAEYVDKDSARKRAEELKAHLRDIVLQTEMDHVVIGDVLEAKVSESGAVRLMELKGNLFFGGE